MSLASGAINPGVRRAGGRQRRRTRAVGEACARRGSGRVGIVSLVLQMVTILSTQNSTKRYIVMPSTPSGLDEW